MRKFYVRRKVFLFHLFYGGSVVNGSVTNDRSREML